jgi:hypothetical protein
MNTITPVFIIQHKATHLCMPQMANGGYTWWEPTKHDYNKEVPRIFWTRIGAVRAIAAWAQGNRKRHQGQDQRTFDGPGEWYDYTETKKPLVARSKDDLEILELELTECKPTTK